MAALHVDLRPIYAAAAGSVGDDFTVTVGLLDTVSGAVDGTGATIVATVGGTSMSVNYATAGLFICTLTDSQTTSLGAGSHTLTFRLTPSGGDTQTYVRGTVTFSSTATASVAGSAGWQTGVVDGVFVVVF